MTKYHIKS